MRVILADVQSSEGWAAKDTVVGGYGSRLVPFSRVTQIYCHFKRSRLELPSIQMGYLAAIFARQGHEVVFTRGSIPEGDVALVLSSLIDHRRETAWAEEARRRRMRVGFIGLAASKLPHLFEPYADFVITGEPEWAAMQMANGAALSGTRPSLPIADLDSLPFPRWDLLLKTRLFPPKRPRRFPALGSRGCTEFCTYCPHRILASYRSRSVPNIADELQQLCEVYPRPQVVFRDPLFTQNRERTLALCDEIRSRGLKLGFDIETRLDMLDVELLRKLRTAGLSSVAFGVESVEPETLRRAGRRPIPEPQQRAMVEACNKLGVITVAYYVIGFLADEWDSIAATIEHSMALGTTFAQFKLLTPYPGTPMWKQFAGLITETDWENFNGYSPVFRHPNLSAEELKFLLGAAYARFYARPGFLANLWQLRDGLLRRALERMDRKVLTWHAEKEISVLSRAAEC